jgi:hypothetical protein
MGISSHGERASFSAAGGAAGSGEDSCASAGLDHPTAIKKTNSPVPRCLMVAGPSSETPEAPAAGGP